MCQPQQKSLSADFQSFLRKSTIVYSARASKAGVSGLAISLAIMGLHSPARAQAVVVNNGTTVAVNTTVNPAGDGLFASTGNDIATLTGSTLNAGSGVALRSTLQGNTSVTANASTINGSAQTAASSIMNVTLQNNTLWNMTGTSNVTSLVNDNSLVAFSAPTGDPAVLASYKTLTAINYTGVGGTLGLNTFLGNDSAPSNRLVINGGAATGSSFLRIANTTGPGALTTGNGILVVDASNGGTTVPGALARPVVAGPYEYSLYRSSRDAAGPQNWYLRSELVPVPPGPPPVPPGPTPGPGPGPAPSPPQPATGIPDYRRETSLYAALPAMELIYGRTLLDSLHERVGELRPLEAPAVTEERTIWCKNPEKNFRCTTVVQLPASAAAPGRSYASAGWARAILHAASPISATSGGGGERTLVRPQTARTSGPAPSETR